ncbi:MAG: hypothetical protein PHC86_03220 [Eubacteriales bacterium]|nr:hypothetical protein [Eubacteriales bacterium]
MNGFLVLMLLVVVGFTAYIIENNHQAELEARMELLRLIRMHNRQQLIPPQAMYSQTQAPRQAVESNGFFMIQNQLSGEEVIDITYSQVA